MKYFEKDKCYLWPEDDNFIKVLDTKEYDEDTLLVVFDLYTKNNTLIFKDPSHIKIKKQDIPNWKEKL